MTRSSVFQKIAPPYLLYFLAIFMTFRPLPTTTVWKWIPRRRCKQHFNLNLIFTRLKKKKKISSENFNFATRVDECIEDLDLLLSYSYRIFLSFTK